MDELNMYKLSSAHSNLIWAYPENLLKIGLLSAGLAFITKGDGGGGGVSTHILMNY